MKVLFNFGFVFDGNFDPFLTIFIIPKLPLVIVFNYVTTAFDLDNLNRSVMVTGNVRN